MTSIEPRGTTGTCWVVTHDDIDGLVEVWGHTIGVYTHQPERRQVTDSDLFLTISVTSAGIRPEHASGETAIRAARRLWDAFNNDPDSRQRIIDARNIRRATKIRELRSQQRRIAERIAELHRDHASLDAQIAELEALGDGAELPRRNDE